VVTAIPHHYNLGMCGRINLKSNMAVIAKQFDAELFGGVSYSPRYNVPPTLPVPVIRQTDGKRQLSMIRWGLVPSWIKDRKKSPLNNNARADTVAIKPSFRAAFKKRRCIVAVDGFYEWETIGKEKLPYYFYRPDGQLLAFAGLWETWHDPDVKDAPPLESCTIITTDANAVMEPVHERMPVILSTKDCDTWLDPAATDLQHLLAPCPPDEIACYRVSKFVNSNKNEGAECMEPLVAAEKGELF
jgi:putative SOS response-associated peptidase YedK